MIIKRVFSVSFMMILVAGCTGMVWYKGAMIQYKKIEKTDAGEYIINVLGSMPHSKEDLESAVLKKARELCGGEATLLESRLGSYNTTTVGGGVVLEGRAPEITARTRCDNA